MPYFYVLSFCFLFHGHNLLIRNLMATWCEYLLPFNISKYKNKKNKQSMLCIYRFWPRTISGLKILQIINVNTVTSLLTTKKLYINNNFKLTVQKATVILPTLSNA